MKSSLLITSIVLACTIILCQNLVNGLDSLLIVNGSINTEYSSLASQTKIHIYQFNLPANATNIMVRTSVVNSDITTPILIYANHNSYVASWFLPFKDSFYPEVIRTISRTSCPDLSNNQSELKNFSIRVQSFSPRPLQFSLQVSNVESNVLELDKQATTAISPSFPQFFVHDIPDMVQFVEVQLTSPSDQCTLVRISSYVCPPNFSLRSSKGFGGFELTMVRVADLRVRRSDFINGRMMILLIPKPAIECETSLEYDQNTTSENFSKNITVVVKQGSDVFLGPVLIVVVIFVIPYILFAIIVGCELICGHLYPPFRQHFAIISSSRGKTNKKDVEYAEQQQHVELGDVKDEHPNEVHENPDKSGDDINNGGKGMYQYNIVNNRQVNVSDLYKKPGKELKKMGLLYPFVIFMIGVFYLVPATQVTYSNQRQVSLIGLQDLCYLNFKCDREVGSLRAFNNIWSNIGYILLSFLFFIITLTKQCIFTSELKARGRPTRGIPQIFGIYYGVAMACFFEGIMSGIYHICPTMTNFQFDITFMYVILTLLIVQLYKNRHPDSALKSTHVFILLTLCVLFTVISLFSEETSNFVSPSRIVLTIGLIAFTGVISYMVYCFFIPQFIILYYKDWKEERNIIRAVRRIFCPQYNRSRILQILLLILSELVILLVLWIPGILTTVASAIQYVIGLNLILYYVYYWVLKIVNREFLQRPCVFIRALVVLIISVICWAIAFGFWAFTPIYWEVSPALARDRNLDCIFLDYFDHHDVWHIMSAFGIFTLYLATLLIDENLSLTPQDEIHVF